MRKTAVYKHPLFLAHQTGKYHLETTERLRCIYQELEREEIASRLIFPVFKKATTASIKLNHTPEHVREVAATATHPASYLDADTRTSADSYEAALYAAGAVIDGINRLESNEIDNAFCLVRPPGHHAERNQSMGFCLFNNVAIGASWAVRKLGLERIMIIDWDLHHGNGTQKSFYRNDKVLYCSTHQYPLYPGSGALPESGEGRGLGYTVNIPLAGMAADDEYARIFNELYVPLARAYQPQLILVSCGFDIMAGDPLGSMQVTPAGVAYMTRVLLELAQELCDGKLLITLEGGYNFDNMRTGALAVLTELHGAPLASNHPVYLSQQDVERLRSARVESASFDQAMHWVKNWWNI
jgi:acetoin utilization deacetylase AcuC-like enzyme